MLSYKQWKMLNESFAGPITLGLGQPTNLGITSSNGFGIPFDEEKARHMKKSKKKMFGGDDELVKGKMPKHAHAHPDVDVDVDGDGDDDMGDDMGGGDDMDMGGDDMGMGGDDMGMGDEEEGDACGRMCGKKSKKKMMKSKKKMWSDADDDAGDEGGDDMGDDEGGDDDAGDEGGDDMGGDDEGGMDATMDKKAPMMSKKRAKKKMKKEAYLDNEAEWMASVKNMLDPKQSSRKYDDGFSRYYEDALFTPVDVNNLTQAVRSQPSDEPGPGEPGYAPQGRVGGFF